MPFWRSKDKKTADEITNETAVSTGQPEPELDVADEPTPAQEPISKEPEKPKVNWIWVEGYKAVYSDMTAKKGNIVYEVGKTYEMSPDLVEECEGGYHLCRRLKDTFQYYSPFEDCNKSIRYYKVKALVPESKWNELPEKDTDVCKTKSVPSYYFSTTIKIDKIAACAICFIEEIDLNTILHAIITEYPNGYHAQYIELAKEFYMSHDFNLNNTKAFHAYILGSECGFSNPMSQYIVEQNLMSKALAFGTQPELTMKEKLRYIF